MTTEDAIKRLEGGCLQDREGRFFFSCRGAVVVIKLHGVKELLHIPARDRVAFRIGAEALIIERLDTGVRKNWFPWSEIESLTAGEPEMAGGALFQG